MKNVLILYYSQSGQLKEIADSICKPFLNDNEIEVTYYQIKMQQEFPFPWNSEAFFNVFPETFQQIPQQIIPPEPEITSKKYDLILFYYQVWYLTPSLPVISFLKSNYAAQLLKDTPVITVSGSRNMWVFAQEKIKKLLAAHKAVLVGNIALTDRNINLVSVITVVDWMFSGIKRKTYGFLPLPGVSQQEITAAEKFGHLIKPYLMANYYEGLQKELVHNNAVEIRHFLVSMDKKANKMFRIWSRLILKNPSKRKMLIRLFNYYLFIAIWLLSPIVHLIETLLYPLLYFKIRKEKKYYQGISQR
ncbi:dialkylrecorsinol condensing enzyme DarA [Paenimyroides ceti]